MLWRQRKNLDSSEKFFLGGAHGVRACPLGRAAGDEGALATLELRCALTQWLDAMPSLVLFADQGYVDINKRHLSPPASASCWRSTDSFHYTSIWADSTTRWSGLH